MAASATAFGDNSTMPDGTQFPMWEKPLHFTKTYYVEAQSRNADDSGPGTKERPFKTINHAAPKPAYCRGQTHISSAFLSRMPTTAAISVHLSVSDLSWRLPAAVSLVEAGSTIVLRRTPLAYEPAPPLQTINCDVEGALQDLEALAGDLPDAQQDAVAMQRPERNALRMSISSVHCGSSTGFVKESPLSGI
jgi:hypothetical protein